MAQRQRRSLTGLGSFLIAILFATPTSWACGGFFCNASQPINQAAERILFAASGGQIEMHVQIQYQGPPTGFGWILPVAPGVETELSSEALFRALDRLYQPSFFLQYNYDESCDDPNQYYDYEDGYYFEEEQQAGEAGIPASEPEPTVQVISREPVGPYDRAILQADNVEVLREWLNENEFQIPDVIDQKLQPYIDAGAVFVVIKLLADSDVGDLVPLKLTFPGSDPVIPILPTAVSAEPDMGMIVHILGETRAIPSNYQHVIINEAAIDWMSSGSNYTDVVSQAADEAMGKAFTTDYAGEIGEQLPSVLQPYSESTLMEIALAQTFGEIQVAVPDRTNPDYQRVFTSIFGESEQAWDLPADGQMLADRLRDEFNGVYEPLNALLTSSAMITRLYTTMSANEMDQDPIFTFNPDLEDVSNFHSASIYITCDESYEPIEQVIELEDGQRFPVETLTPIARQDGETVRGQEVPAAARIERMYAAGQPTVIKEIEITNTGLGQMNGGSGPSEELCRMLPTLCSTGSSGSPQPSTDDSGSSSSGDSGGCQQRVGSTPALPLLFSLFGWLLRRQRRLA